MILYIITDNLVCQVSLTMLQSDVYRKCGMVLSPLTQSELSRSGLGRPPSLPLPHKLYRDLIWLLWTELVAQTHVQPPGCNSWHGGTDATLRLLAKARKEIYFLLNIIYLLHIHLQHIFNFGIHKSFIYLYLCYTISIRQNIYIFIFSKYNRIFIRKFSVLICKKT